LKHAQKTWRKNVANTGKNNEPLKEEFNNAYDDYLKKGFL
jgi:hypothetical protein